MSKVVKQKKSKGPRRGIALTADDQISMNSMELNPQQALITSL